MSDGRRKVWILESGEYSDYRVGAVFEREEDAQAAVEAGIAEEYSERVLFAPGVVPTRTVRGWTGSAHLSADGRVQEPHVWPHAVDDSDELEPGAVELFPERVEVDVHMVRRVDGSIYTRNLGAKGYRREDVLKALSDRLGRLKAEQEGVA